MTFSAMVVCNTSAIPPAPVSCSVTPVIPSYSPGLCPITQAPAVQFQPRFPTLISMPVTTQTYGQDFSGPPPPYYSAQTLHPAVIPAPIPMPYSTTMPPQTPMIPFPVSSAPVIPCVPAKGTDATALYNSMRTMFTTVSPSNTTPIIACGPRIFGHEVCSPGLCSHLFSTTPGTVGPTLTSTILPNSTRICQIAPNVLTIQWKQSYGMEQVWQSEFKTLFAQYAPHVWLLLPINQTPPGVWNANVDSAKVRFYCEDCGHGWTSMKGRVAFWFILNPVGGEGIVCLKLYGQQCDRCKTGNYEPAMWYPEEVLKVLVNIYNKVGQIYYGFQQAPYHRTRRPGKPRTPHNSDLCQACKDGVCSERK